MLHPLFLLRGTPRLHGPPFSPRKWTRKRERHLWSAVLSRLHSPCLHPVALHIERKVLFSSGSHQRRVCVVHQVAGFTLSRAPHSSWVAPQTASVGRERLQLSCGYTCPAQAAIGQPAAAAQMMTMAVAVTSGALNTRNPWFPHR